MMIFALVEAASRSLLLATGVWAGLRALRVSNVLAQKRVWCLVLVSALVMPLAMRWQALPAALTVMLPAQALTRPADNTSMERVAEQPGSSLAQTDSASPATSSPAPEAVKANSKSLTAPVASSSDAAIRADSSQTLTTTPTTQATPRWNYSRLISLAGLLYFAVWVCLLFRLLYGVSAAALLWMRATPISPDSLPAPHSSQALGLSLRSSRAISSPVTIGSGVLLPAEYVRWDTQKLRIVLAHERSHVRQGDFYLQLLAELYAAMFWFSPLGWWLKRKLCDLSETISDRAGLGAAESGPSYAQVLLEFAAMPRLTMRGVAMARPNNLSRRIERLLNESTFRQAFAGGGRRALLAVLLVPLALFTAAALIRVEAASQSTPPATVQELAPIEPVVDAPVLPSAPVNPVAPLPPSETGAPAMPEAVPALPAPPEPPAGIVIANGGNLVIANGHNMMMTSGHGSGSGQGKGKGYSYGYSYSDNGDSYALIAGNGEHNTFSGDWHGRNAEAIEKARHMTHGDFLWFERGGKSYVIDDPAIVSQIQAMYKPIEELGNKQAELGKKQEELGKKQEELGRRMEEVTIPTPDVSKEIAELEAQMQKLKSMQGKTMTTEEWAEIESKLGDLQGKLGAIQGEIGAKQGSFGGEMGKLGAMQGELGGEQGRLGAEQGRLAQEADRKIKSIIDQSLSNGKARPVE